MIPYCKALFFMPISHAQGIMTAECTEKEGFPDMKTPVTKEKLRNHLTYSLWKYAVLAAVAIFGWNIIYSITAYRVPDEKKIVVGVYSYGSDINLNAYMEQVRQDLLPEMEAMEAMYIMPDETYGAMILTTRVAARDCDIYVLPRTEFQNYAAQGAYMALDEVLPDLIDDLTEAGVSLSRGSRTNEETGEKHQYAIPCASLPGMQSMLQCDTSDMYIGVFFATGNDENVLTFFEQFIRDMMIEPVIEELPAE